MTKYFLAFFVFVYGISCLFGQTPTAQFSASPLTVCEGETVTFTSLSNPNGASQLVSYVWDFGDGSIGNGQTTTHIFTSAGNKNITLTVVNSNGISDFEYKPNYIVVKPTPVSDFSISGIGCTVPLTISFNNLSSGGNTYSWNFGNGQSSTAFNPPSQTYTQAGEYDAILTVTSSNGCISSDTQTVVVSNYQADFILPSVGCVGQPVSFEDNSTAGANSWNWSFGGQGSSADQNPTFIFNTAGTYTILLSSQNTISGCSGSSSQQITIEPTPSPSFTANPTSNCAPADITFTNTSFGGTSYVWNFGDGQTFDGTSPGSHTYYLNGTYDVTLTMVTSTGCSGITTLSDYIEITDIQALFNADVTGGCNPLTVNFSDSSITPSTSNPIVSWNWTFGNGQTFNGQNPPAQTYTIGVYDVSLTVQTQSGCVGTIAMDNYITVGEINSLNFSVDTLVNCIKKDFLFNSDVVTTPIVTDSTDLEYFWDFTDGTSTDPNPTYQFTSDTGYFDVQLVVDFRGCKDTLEIDSLIYINAPISKFTPEQTLFCNPNPFPSVTANVNDEATHGQLTDDVYMIWSWGDGDTTFLDDFDLDDANLGSVSHVYSEYGTYTIEQVIYNYTTGCEDSTTSTINVTNVVPAFTISNDSICNGDSLFLADQSSTWSEHSLSTWSYAMGNGSTVIGENTSYVYNLPNPFVGQTYQVTLTVTNSVGCSATTTLPIHVLPNPFPSIGFDTDSICIYNSVTFSSNASSSSGIPISSIEYFFPDDNSSVDAIIGQQIPHSYNSTGTFNTEVVVTDQFGCVGQSIIPINVIQPNSVFTVENVICNGDSIFTDNSSSGIQPLNYQWLNDGNFLSSNLNAETNYTETNLSLGVTSSVHNLTLIATDGIGCKDTSTATIYVSLPWAIPTFTFTGSSIGPNGMYICPPLIGAYIDSSISYGQITSWSWDFGDGDISDDQNPNNSYVFPGLYDLTLEITDSYGCVDDTVFNDYVMIGGPSGEPDWTQQVGQCAQGAYFTIANPVNVDSTYWVMGDNQYVIDSLDFFYNFSEPGTYTPGVYLYDESGCDVFYPLEEITVLDDGLEAYYSASPNPAALQELITFADSSTSASSSIVLWMWDFEVDTILSTTNLSQEYSYPTAGSYYVTLTVTDILGCQDSYSTLIKVKDPDIWLPNVITANNDGTNDFFVLPIDGFKNYTVTILNRWGNVMRIGERDPANPLFLWDGTDQNGNKCADGVYFYHFTGEMLGGTMVDKQGFVTVIESK
jgi:PKD repeat protein